MMGMFPLGRWEDETDEKDTAPSEIAPAPVETEQERVDRLWRAVCEASQT